MANKVVVYPPIVPPTFREGVASVFLGGSIEMGKAVEWQDAIIQKIPQKSNVVILNPRRKDWDSTWEQSPDNAKFREQVEWELGGITTTDIVFFYFQPETKAPITLMELGLTLGRIDPVKIIVCCPKKFWRWGNVVITCEMKGVEVYEDLDDATNILLKEIAKYNV